MIYHYSFFIYKNEYLSLFDVLEINNHRQKLLLDIKLVPKAVYHLKAFREIHGFLNSGDVKQISSLDVGYLRFLLGNGFSNMEIGLIINVLSKHLLVRPRKIIDKLPYLNFLSISSELWEKDGGQYAINSKMIYPNAERYAWTWNKRPETKERINTFIKLGADGIRTKSPNLVLDMWKKYPTSV